MSDTTTITQLALDLHTDLANIKAYGTKSPAVTRALIIEVEAKLKAFSEHMICVRRSLLVAQAPSPDTRTNEEFLAACATDGAA